MGSILFFILPACITGLAMYATMGWIISHNDLFPLIGTLVIAVPFGMVAGVLLGNGLVSALYSREYGSNIPIYLGLNAYVGYMSGFGGSIAGAILGRELRSPPVTPLIAAVLAVLLAGGLMVISRIGQ